MTFYACRHSAYKWWLLLKCLSNLDLKGNLKSYGTVVQPYIKNTTYSYVCRSVEPSVPDPEAITGAPIKVTFENHTRAWQIHVTCTVLLYTCLPSCWWEMRTNSANKTHLTSIWQSSKSCLCVEDDSGAPFRGSWLPLTPRMIHTGPYVRLSGPMRLPSQLYPQTRRNTGNNDQTASRPTFGEIIDEVKIEIGTLLNLFSDNLHVKILG